jgi:hypothetical protein
MLADSTTIPSSAMALFSRDARDTRDARFNGTTFFARRARFIVPACWLLVAAMRLADAVRTGATAAWLGAAGFAGVAVLLHPVFRQIDLKRRAGAARDGDS